MIKPSLLLALALLGTTLQGTQTRPEQSRPAPDREPAEVAREAAGADAKVRDAFDKRSADAGVFIDRKAKRVALRGQFNSPRQPLEYLVTAPHGSHYESLIAIEAKPSDIAAALLSLGVEFGTNPVRKKKEGALKEGELPYEVEPGKGGGVFLYVEWNDDRGFHRNRIEDLVFERPEGRTIPNARFLFTNSVMIEPRAARDVRMYAANADGNFASCGFGGAPVLSYPKPHPFAMEGDFEIYQPNWTLVPTEPLPLTLILSADEILAPLESRVAPPPASAPSSRPAPGERGR